MLINVLTDPAVLPTALGVGIPTVMAIGAALATRIGAREAPVSEESFNLLLRPRHLVEH